MKPAGVQPSPVIVYQERSKADINNILGIESWDEEKFFSILKDLMLGYSKKEACERNGTNIQTLLACMEARPIFKSNIKKALKFRAKLLKENFYTKTRDTLNSIEELNSLQKAQVLSRLHRPVERLTELDDEEQNLKAKNQEVEKSSGNVITVKDFIGDIGKNYDLEKARVDAPGKDIKDQYVNKGDE